MSVNWKNLWAEGEAMDFKQIEIDGLVPFAKGATGECFRVGEDQILKLYYDGFPKERALLEKRNARTAFVAGIPTPISFDAVTVNGRYGIIYEMISARTLSEQLQESPERSEEIGQELAHLALSIHNATVKEKDFPRSSEKIAKSLPHATYLDEKTRENVENFMQKLDEAQTYTHGDFHTNNIMQTRDGIMLIDMGSFSVGSPLFDLGVLHFSFFESPESVTGEVSSFNGLDRKTREAVWDSFEKEYFNGVTKEEKERQLKELNKVILLIKLRFEALYSKHASEEYCKKVRDEVLKVFS